MSTTKIDADKTAGVIQSLLADAGATKIQMEYSAREITGLAFIIEHGGKEIPFRLPIRWEPVLAAMIRDRHTPNGLCKEEQARRTAWRQIYRWVQAQLALIEVGMVDVKEVFMPYMLVSPTHTLYERLEDQGFKRIGYEETK